MQLHYDMNVTSDCLQSLLTKCLSKLPLAEGVCCGEGRETHSEVDELSLGEGGESWDGEGEGASSQCGDDDGLGDGDSVQQDEEAGHQHLDNQPHGGLECWRLL